MPTLHRSPDSVELLIRFDDDGTTALSTWGSFRRSNAANKEMLKAVYQVVVGSVASVTLGGGASPMVTITKLA